MTQGRRTTRRPKAKRATAEQPKSDGALGPMFSEAIELFALLMARCNAPRKVSYEYFRKCLESLPSSVGFTPEPAGEHDEDQIPADVLSHWYLTPRYVLNARPRALAAYGGPLSVAGIVRRVSRSADPEAVLAYLLKTAMVKKVGELYAPQGRIVQHRFAPTLQRMHHLRVTVGVMRTVEGNARLSGNRRQYQFVADGFVPVSQVPAFSKEMAEPSNELLKSADAAIFRRSGMGKAGERKVRVSVSVILNDGQKLPRVVRGRRGTGNE